MKVSSGSLFARSILSAAAVVLLLLSGCMPAASPAALTPAPSPIVAAQSSSPAPAGTATAGKVISAPDTSSPATPTATFAPTATAAAATAAPAGQSMATPGDSSSGAPNLYQDPAGKFTVPVPTNWQARQAEGYVALTDPEDATSVYIAVVQDANAEQGIADAWAKVEPSFKLAVKQSGKPPSLPGVDETVAVTYDTADPARFVQAVGQRVGNNVFVVLIDGKTDAVMKRAAQVQTIASGLKIGGVAQADLTGVQPKQITPELLAQLETFINDTMTRTGVPGAEVAIVQNGQVVYAKGFGVREMGKPDPVTPDTLMMIGSTGKTMTTMMMATLVDDKRMTWDTPAVAILPSFAVADPAITPQVTMRNLVCACTGVPRRDLELIFNASKLTAQDIVASLKTFKFLTGFGETFQYSNQMVATGGYIAAVAAGASPSDMYDGYVKQMQQRIFGPIGMTHTTFSFDQVQATPDHATPHTVDVLGQYKPAPLSEEKLLAPVAPAGASWSNAADMARYLITLMNEGVSPDGKRVVSAENLKVTWQPQVQISADSHYGLGWFLEKYKGLQVIDHAGNTFGFTSDLAFLPAQKLGIVVLANARLSNLFNMAVRYRLWELAFGQTNETDAMVNYQLDAQAKTRQDLRTQLGMVDPVAVKPYLGSYTNEALGDVTLSLQESKLILDAGEFTAELRPVTDPTTKKTTYLFMDGPFAGVSFEFSEDAGKPTLTLLRPPDRYTFVKR